MQNHVFEPDAHDRQLRPPDQGPPSIHPEQAEFPVFENVGAELGRNVEIVELPPVERRCGTRKLMLQVFGICDRVHCSMSVNLGLLQAWPNSSGCSDRSQPAPITEAPVTNTISPMSGTKQRRLPPPSLQSIIVLSEMTRPCPAPARSR